MAINLDGGFVESRRSRRRLRIFIVENHVDTLRYLRLYLEQLGYLVGTAETVQSARIQLTREPWDVLISDIGLPDGTGWDLLAELKDMRPKTCVAISGFGMQADVDQSRAAGFDCHMIKPFQPEDLEKLLVAAEGTEAEAFPPS